MMPLGPRKKLIDLLIKFGIKSAQDTKQIYSILRMIGVSTNENNELILKSKTNPSL